MSSSSIHPKTQEIPVDQWIAFLAEFTHQNRGAHARLEIISSDEEPFDQVETEGRPLEGVSADVKDRERTVWISFVSPDQDRLTHGVHHVTAIRVLPATESTGPTLEVESGDGAKTLLELEQLGAHSLPE